MTFKDGEKYFGITFRAERFVSYAAKIGLEFTCRNFGNIQVELIERGLPAAISRGLEEYAEKISGIELYSFWGMREKDVDPNLILLMAALINKYHNLNTSNE